MKEFWDFESGGVPSSLLQRTGGSGSVSVSGGELVIDAGGTVAADRAAVVYDTALDTSKYVVMAAKIRVSGDNPSTFYPNMIGLYDSATAPTGMANSARLTAQRIWVEDRSTGTASTSEWKGQFKNPS